MLLSLFDGIVIDPELLLDAVGFALVGLLGLLPIFVMTLSEHLRDLHLPRLRLRTHLAALKAAVLLAAAEWTARVFL
ncbi:hypothetical protein [Aggregatilinea lenta]|uniref:hypothetical protein n=1 Tax=Aggregatilinea lenta TaxID=913108 RepID=UPI000E5B29AB|nr:hypothetical protein [Aggregatilinea lenta]